MKFTELKNDLESAARTVYLLEGDDAYFRTRAEEQIKAKFLTMPELNYSSYDGGAYKGASLSEITSAMSAFPFMAEKRIIRIGDFYPTEDEYEKYLKSAFENCPDTTIVIIVNPPAKKGCDLKRKKCVTYVDCNRSDEETVTKWVYLTLKRAGIACTVDAGRAVAAYCLCDMSRVSKEVEKLTELGVPQITVKEVDDLVYKDADYRIYEMTNAIARKNYSLFAEICNDLTVKGMDENALISSLLSYFKNLLIILSSSESDARLAEKMKMKEFAVKKSREAARSFGRSKLTGFVNSLYALSSDLRGSKITPEGAFSCALANIFFAER
ncbi:MAG: DNA polymerase III subunit delta [Candidatus Coproplasma sp.]